MSGFDPQLLLMFSWARNFAPIAPAVKPELIFVCDESTAEEQPTWPMLSSL